VGRYSGGVLWGLFNAIITQFSDRTFGKQSKGGSAKEGVAPTGFLSKNVEVRRRSIDKKGWHFWQVCCS